MKFLLAILSIMIFISGICQENVLENGSGAPLEYEEDQEEPIYDSLKTAFSKYWITKELHGLIFSDEKKLQAGGFEVISSEQPYEPYRFMTINRIIIKRLNPFGTSVADTTMMPSTLLEKTGNSLHILTREYVIRENLIIREGDIVIPYRMADNEYILRKLPFIKDVQLLIKPVQDEIGSVDVFVIVRDIWPIDAVGSVESIDKYKVNLYSVNFMGFGHRLDNELIADVNQKPPLGTNHKYRIENIKGSFISGEIGYAENYEREYAGIKFTRKFYSTDTKYGGGIEISQLASSIGEDDTIYANVHHEYQTQDIWFGRAMQLKSDIFPIFNKSNIIVAGRINSRSFDKRPITSESHNKKYHNRTRLLASISLSKRIHYKGSYIYNYGKIESIPIGHLVVLTGGVENGEYYNRAYLGFSFSRAKYVEKMGYFHRKFALGSYIKDGGFEQVAANAAFTYFSTLISSSGYHARIFAKGDYLVGIKRWEDEYLKMNDLKGVRGLFPRSLTGKQRIRHSLEAVVFTPWYLYGFRFAVFLFADAASVTSNKKFVYSRNFQWGYGLGLRIRNERLIFKTLQLQFSIYPNAVSDAFYESLAISRERSLSLEDFDGRAPDVIPYE